MLPQLRPVISQGLRPGPLRHLSDRLGLITANATTPYILNFIDLSETGPLVIELPPGPTAGGVSDFWQREIGVLGEMGLHQGRGGKHLVVPPDQDVPEAEGFHVLRSTGVNIMFGFRTLDPDPGHAQALVGPLQPYFDKTWKLCDTVEG
jgi:hypothetical protein